MKVTNTNLIKNKLTQMETSIVESFQTNNEILEQYFKNIAFLSDILPTYLNQVTVLADQVTDLLVMNGNTKLSATLQDLKVVSSKGIQYQANNGSVELLPVNEYVYQINVAKSNIISNSNNYSIFNRYSNTLGTIGDLLANNEEVVIKSKDRTYNYTFALSLSSKSVINGLTLQLSEDTESYPLISEIYYIDENNRKINCFIYNSNEHSLDLDYNRVDKNIYNIAIQPVQTDRLYITLEDSNKVELAIKSLILKKTKYEKEGEIVFGPLISSYPILKASIDALSSKNVKFYVSHDNMNYIELIRVQDIDLKSNTTKVVKYNTVSNNSISTSKDVRELYLKIKLTSIAEETDPSITKTSRISFSTDTLNIPTAELISAVVYKDENQMYYGGIKSYQDYKFYKAFDSKVLKVVENTQVKIKGFVDSSISYSVSSPSPVTQIEVHSLPLKAGSEIIDSQSLDPFSTKFYGYILTKQKTKDFSTDATDIVLKLKSEYTKGVYKVRQDNKEIEVDLSLGYLNSCSDAIVVVKSEIPVELYNELGTKIKDLTPFKLGENTLINLLQEEMFELPKSKAKVFNVNYPFVLNTSETFSVENNSIINTERLIELSGIYTIVEEYIQTGIHISKENATTLKVSDLRLLDRYTKEGTHKINAFTENKATKLKDKNIKKGSIQVKKYSDPYLNEVSYKNGIDEFKMLVYRTEKHTIQTTEETIKELEISLDFEAVDLDNIQINIQNRYEVNLQIKYVSEEEKNKLIVYTTDNLFNDEVIEITYLYVNSQPSNYFSVDHDAGIFYLSDTTNSDIEITYQYFHTYLKGSKATQLHTEDYTLDSGTINIKDIEESTSYLCIYDFKSVLDIPKTTPILTNLVLHYINTRDQDSLF